MANFKNYKNSGRRGIIDTFFLKDQEKTKFLTAKEEIELGKKISEGDLEARNELVEHNYPLVINIAKKHFAQGLDLEDLIQEGNIGLMKAADKFDYKRGYRFTTYATWWITQRIYFAISKSTSSADTSKNGAYMSGKINKAKILLKKELEREPSTEELAKIVGLSVAQLSRYLSMKNFRLIYLGDRRYSDNESSLEGAIPDMKNHTPEEEVLHSYCVEQLERALETLSSREKNIFILRQGLFGYKKKTCEELGALYQLSRERIRQIEHETWNYIRNYISEEDVNAVHKQIKKRENKTKKKIIFDIGELKNESEGKWKN
jgi:RNA polymerase primary sigma factor